MKNLITLLLFFYSIHTFGQYNIRESVYSHLSSSELIVGETLHFKNYVLSEHTGRLSSLSRILYVELLNAAGDPVYQSKLLLDNGQGGGNYFIPADLETGNYHFVTYTRWMKNFESFSQQCITIINPYQNQNFTAAPEVELKVKIAVEGGDFVAGVKNKVVLRVTDQFGVVIQTQGKIVAKKSGETSDFTTDSFGFASLILTPDVGETYQLILENGQNFEFFDLPVSCDDCNAFRVIATEDLFVVRLSSSETESFTQGQLEVLMNQQPEFSSPVVSNSSLSIPKRNLPEGLLMFVYTENGDSPRERLIWNGSLPKQGVLSLGTYSPLSEVDLSFEILDSAILSVSVEQVDDKSKEQGVAWNSKLSDLIDLELPFEFYQKTDAMQLDDVLIAAESLAAKENPSLVRYLPEYRSGIVEGVVHDKSGGLLTDIPVGLAFAGVQPQMSVTKTDSLGRFVLTFNPEFMQGQPIVESLEPIEGASILVGSEYYSNYPRFVNTPVVFDSAKVATIVRRSINNQINNAYYVTKNEEPLKERVPQFYGGHSYSLDDYTRFTTMRDTFIEVIGEVGVSKNENKYKFRMRSQDMTNKFFKEYSTLLLLDGAFVEPDDLMNLSPYLVERIDILNQRYYFGSVVIDGVISVHTFANDRGEIKPKGTAVDLINVQNATNGRVFQIDPKQNPRIPYYQDLIYWNPDVNHTGGSLSVKFSTSEVKGLFEVRLEGISKEGRPISRRAYFEVK